MGCYLKTREKEDCCGCESCQQICPKAAIHMEQDEELFYYPVIDSELCIHCSLCEKRCPNSGLELKNLDEVQSFYGGYIKDPIIRERSTSGGAFSAIVEAFCDKDYVIIGAAFGENFTVRHECISNISDLNKFRKSKYSQSSISNAYKYAEGFLKDGKKVLFSGTPCQIAGLKAYLGIPYDKLLTVDVVCESVPSPIFINKYIRYCELRYGVSISGLDYRDKNNSKADLQCTTLYFENGRKKVSSRWFSPFWSIWLKNMMSRPSCYNCNYTTKERVSDISLADLWSLHLYDDELYGANGGTSLIICNSAKGEALFDKAKQLMVHRLLDSELVMTKQRPLRERITRNPQREAFMADLKSLSYKEICRKWYKRITYKQFMAWYLNRSGRRIRLNNLKRKRGTKK